MAHIFKYAILMAIPNALRGERVNVGLVVLLNGRIDVRFSDLAKIRAITGQDWAGYAADVESRLVSQFANRTLTEESIRVHPKIDPAFVLSDIALMSVNSLDQYEDRVYEILKSLVIRPDLG